MNVFSLWLIKACNFLILKINTFVINSSTGKLSSAKKKLKLNYLIIGASHEARQEHTLVIFYPKNYKNTNKKNIWNWSLF